MIYDDEREVVDAGHLGGYVVGGDPDTWYPALWTWLFEAHGVRSVLDLGCGEGHSTRFFRQLGAEAVGVEGTEQGPDIDRFDFTDGPWEPGRDFDLVWACEFLEHLDERYLPNLVPAFSSAPLVLVTHAFPNQPGHHHTNCRSSEYWLGFFAGIGLEVDWPMTNATRIRAGANTAPLNHYLRSGLALRRP